MAAVSEEHHNKMIHLIAILAFAAGVAIGIFIGVAYTRATNTPKVIHLDPPLVKADRVPGAPVEIYTDQETGCQYIGTGHSYSGLTPRMYRDGAVISHLCMKSYKPGGQQ